MKERIEHDSMGEIAVNADRLWGAQTERSRRNFVIGKDHEQMPDELIYAIAKIKEAGHKEEWLEEMWKAAYENTKGDITVGELESYITQAFNMGMIDDDIRDHRKTDVYVVTNEDGRYGAAAILIKEFMEDLLERIGEYHIIPSSIHELLVVPNAIAGELKTMVREMNDTVVEVKEVLSYNIYRYDSRKKEVVAC